MEEYDYKEHIIKNVYKVTFYNEWTGEAKNMVDRRAKAEALRHKTTNDIVGDSIEDAIENMKINHIKPVVVDIEKTGTYEYYNYYNENGRFLYSRNKY